MKHLFISIFMFLGLVGFGQSNICGTVYDKSMRDRLIENKKAYFKDIDFRTEGDWIFVPIQFHIVTKSDGKGGVNPEKVLDELNNINKDYSPFKMRFYFYDDFNKIAYDKLYNTPSEIFAQSKIKTNKKKFKKAINVFIVNNIPSIGGGGVTLGYYTSNLDVLVVRASVFGIKGQTLSHEIGHFFSLDHPFEGWFSEPYKESLHGNPLNVLKTSEGKIIEFMDKSNCETAADLICDTPPDYNFGFTDPERNCKLDETILDYHGDTIVTMENNYMSYYFGCGKYEFTQMQISAMKADYNSNGRSFLRSDYIPDTITLNYDNLNVIYPKNDETAEYYDYVNLDWEDIPNATDYLVKIGLKSQSFNSDYYFVKGKSNLLLKNLKKGKKYRWYVRPFNNGNTKGGKLMGGNVFTAGDWTIGVNDETEFNEMSIYPNPISNGQVYIESNNTFSNTIIEVVSMEGKLIEKIKTDLQKGENRLNLTHSNYQKGFYNFIINTGDKKYIRKVLFEK